ncbi:MAG: hypothetical protein KDD58_06875 [Bdellovibrionales bacterium]|nr:hypothetical protein [Bdellovibrionales bacterium]
MNFLVIIFVFIFSFNCFSQEEENPLADNIVNYLEANYYELGAQTGSMLPFSISNVEETYPVVGVWWAHPTHYGHIDWLLQSAKAKGVTWYEAMFSLRIDFSVYDFFSGYFRLGPQFVHYQAANSSSSDFETTYGAHAGFGSYIQMAGPYWGRVDFKFGWGPGSTMDITFGIVYRWNSESSSDN